MSVTVLKRASSGHHLDNSTGSRRTLEFFLVISVASKRSGVVALGVLAGFLDMQVFSLLSIGLRTSPSTFSPQHLSPQHLKRFL